jgi:hypothetical protein
VNRGLTVLALAFTLAGCGGDDNGPPSASEDYANSVCGDLSSWVADQQATLKSLEDAGPSISREDVRAAVVHVRDSTQVLFLVGLEPLDVPADPGNQAKTELDKFEMKLLQRLGMVNRAVEGNTGVVALASMLTTALSAATNEVKSTLDELQNLDSDELKDAFQASDECKMLRDEVESIGSGSLAGSVHRLLALPTPRHDSGRVLGSKR